jgi:hypothetical protein
MIRNLLVCFLFALTLLLLPIASIGGGVVIDATDTATPTVEVNVGTPGQTGEAEKPRLIAIRFSGLPAGHVLQRGTPVSFDVHLTNPGAEQQVIMKVLLTTGFGSIVYEDTVRVVLPDHGEEHVHVDIDGSTLLPQGPYILEAWAQGDDIGQHSTRISVWNGPAPTPFQTFGISYAGPLFGSRMRSDLDLFRAAGIGWLRFSLHGWLPQGQVNPTEAAVFDQFIQEAGDRQFSMVAAFHPKMSADPATDPVQADKDYLESLMAAATRYGFKVKTWELMRVKPDPNFPQLRGIGYGEIARGREALRKTDKTLQAIMPLDDPFVFNAQEMHLNGMPGKGDVMGMHFNFSGLPEHDNITPRPPVAQMEELTAVSKKALKQVPPIWATEFGFDVNKGSRLPHAMFQAAVISRAHILNLSLGLGRTFWRHSPEAKHDLPFTDDDGAAMPSLLAMRTTMEMLNGVTKVSEVLTFPDVKTFLLSYGTPKRRGKNRVRQVLAVWSIPTSERPKPIGAMTIKTTASELRVTDLWGNTIELHPANGVAIFPVDEFPRFIDLGKETDVELFRPFIAFEPSPVELSPGGANELGLKVVNNQMLFQGDLSLTFYLRRWPGGEDAKELKVSVPAHGALIQRAPLSIPDDAVKGQVYEVNADVLVGTRRIGYLVLPVWYNPDAKPAPVLPQ